MLTPMSHGDPRPAPRSPAAPQDGKKLQGVLGMGLDDDGGHRRMTKGPEYQLVGGSAETHERMQDLMRVMTEKLKRDGKKIGDINRTEFEHLARESLQDL